MPININVSCDNCMASLPIHQQGDCVFVKLCEKCIEQAFAIRYREKGVVYCYTCGDKLSANLHNGKINVYPCNCRMKKTFEKGRIG